MLIISYSYLGWTIFVNSDIIGGNAFDTPILMIQHLATKIVGFEGWDTYLAFHNIITYMGIPDAPELEEQVPQHFSRVLTNFCMLL